MKKYTLIMGNISFDDDTVKIHSIAFVKQFENKDDAINTGEELINIHEAYIIPEIYPEPIIFDIQ